MSCRQNQPFMQRPSRIFPALVLLLGQVGRGVSRWLGGGPRLHLLLLLPAWLGLAATSAMALTFDYESGVVGFTGKTITQTVSGVELKATSVREDMTRSLVVSAPSVAGYDSLIAGTAAGETSVTFSLNGGKIFDLSSISFMENTSTNEVLTLVSSKGQSLVYNLGYAGTFNVAGDVGAAKMQGITSFTVTANPSNFSISFDNIVIDNIVSPPSVTASLATDITTSSATLNGSVDANGSFTNVSVDYGTSSSYGSSITPTVGATVAANAGASATSVTLTGLACHTTYHFRINGVNASGAANGGDSSFTTSNCPGAYANASFDYESNVNGLSGMGGNVVTQTVAGETLVAHSSTDKLIGNQAVSTYLGNAIPPISGAESLYAGATYYGESFVTFSLNSNKPFDLKSIAFKELISSPESITLRSNKGSTSYSIDANSTGTLNLPAAAEWQGITDFTVTANPSNFGLAIDNIVLENIYTASPSATSNTASSISSTGATLNGTVNGQTSDASVSFDYGTTTGYGSNVAATTGATASAHLGSRASAVALTGLICNSTYHFRVKAVNAGGTAYGDDTTFTTGACPITYSVSYDGNGGTGSVPADGTAYSGGATVSVAGNSLTRTGYVFAGWNTAADGSGSAYTAGSGSFAINANTILYATWMAIAPGASTASASGITASGATLNGSVNDNGLSTAVSFDYGTTIGYGSNVAATTGGTVGAGAGSTAVATSLAALGCNTSYHYRVKAVSDGGISYGSDASFTTNPCLQSITFNPPAAQDFGSTPTLAASADSGLAVTFSSLTSAVCSITSGGSLSFAAAGLCSIQADQAGNGSYMAAAPVAHSFSVNAIAPGAPILGSTTAGDGQISVAFTAPSATGGAALIGYTASCSSSDGGVSGSNSSSTVTPILVSSLSNGKSYTCHVTASNGISGPASADSVALIPKASQSISFANPGTFNFGSSQSLSATSSSGAAPSFNSATPGVCTISSSGALSFISAGNCTINADLAGDASHLAASTVSQTFAVAAVAPGVPTGVSASASDSQVSVSFSAPTDTGGKALSSYTVSCTSADGGSSGSNSGSASPITVTGLSNGKSYGCNVRASNGISGLASLDSSPVTPKGSQSISFANPGSFNFGTSPTLSATSSSGIAPSFSSSTSSVCTISSSGVLSFVSAGLCTISADADGDGSYLAATTVSQTFNVAAVAPGVPTGVSASASDGLISVSFSAPAASGGKALSSYSASCTSSNGGVAGSSSGPASPLTVSGLSNHKSYTCAVTASNAAGLSSGFSVASDAVTPTPSPTVISVIAPANGHYKAGSQLDFTVNWDSQVLVSGAPQLALVIGTTTVQASYQSIASSATTSLFRYTVLVGQNDSDGISLGALSLNGGSIHNSGGVNATLALSSVDTSQVLVDTSAPTLPAANIVVNNQNDPHQVVLSFSEPLASASIASAAQWQLAGNGGTPLYRVASVALANGNQLTLSLAAVDVLSSATTISNAAANAHLQVTPPATLTDLAGNAYIGGTVLEAGGTLQLDSTAPTLANVSSTANSSGGSLDATASEKARGYWIAVASGELAPSVAEVKAAVAYRGVSIAASSSDALANGSPSTLAISGLAASKTYDLYLIAEDAAGTLSAAVSSASLTTTAAPVAPVTPVTPTPTTPATTVTLPASGTTTARTGQTLVVSSAGNTGATINLPAPSSSGNSVNISLPGSGTVAVSSTSAATQLGVSSLTPPGSTTPVSAVVVNSGSASFTAQRSGQLLVALPSGVMVIAGSASSQTQVDASGSVPVLAVNGGDTLVIPTGTTGVAGTLVKLPMAATGATPVTLQVGAQTLTVQSGQANSSISFTMLDQGGVSTPVLAVAGSVQVSSNTGNQPLLAIAGSVLRSGSGQAGQPYTTTIVASTNSAANGVQVSSGYIVLPANAFGTDAGVGESVVWAGESADFDAGGKLVSAYLGSHDGLGDMVGNALGNAVGAAALAGKGAATSYRSSVFVPRLAGSPLRLAGARLDASIFSVLNKAADSRSQPTMPEQSSQGVWMIALAGERFSILPSQRIRVDSRRADGLTLTADGKLEVATAGLVTTFIATPGDPQAFAAELAASLPLASCEQRANGSWLITANDGNSYVARPQWGQRATTFAASGFSSMADGSIRYHNKGLEQLLLPDFHDYASVASSLRTALKDPQLAIQQQGDGSVQVTTNGAVYRLAPQWQLLNHAAVSGKPDWWVEQGIVYLKNADGSAQGFRVLN